MALITCSECGREISDVASSCPHCGYVMNKVSVNQMKRTPLFSEQRSYALGVFLIAAGVIFSFGSLLLMVAFLPFGILGLIVCFAAIFSGVQQLNGIQKGTCPYCGNAVSISAKDFTCKCPHCRKTSTKKGDYIETID